MTDFLAPLDWLSASITLLEPSFTSLLLGMSRYSVTGLMGWIDPPPKSIKRLVRYFCGYSLVRIRRRVFEELQIY
jgi:hypothetical protein